MLCCLFVDPHLTVCHQLEIGSLLSNPQSIRPAASWKTAVRSVVWLHSVYRSATVFVPHVDGFGHDGVSVFLRYLKGKCHCKVLQRRLRVQKRCVQVLSFTHIAQKLDHAFRPADAHQHDLVAEEDLQGNKHQDLTGATDHFVPHPENKH